MASGLENARMWSTKQVVWAFAVLLGGAISLTISGTLIYAEFILHGNEIQNLEDDNEKLTNDIISLEESLNGRMDRKTVRIEEDVKKNKTEIDKLKAPNSDSKKEE